MLNQFVLVGKIEKIEEMEGKQDALILTVAVPRSFKNIDGVYETDIIDCLVFNWETVKENCKKGAIVGIKGRISKLDNKAISLVSEKVTYLSSKKED